MFSSPEGYGVAVVAISVFLFVLRWTSKHQEMFLREERIRVDELTARVEVAERKNLECEWRVTMLVAALREHGIDLPREFWTSGPGTALPTEKE